LLFVVFVRHKDTKKNEYCNKNFVSLRMFFSIVITTYNAEGFLAEALNSLKNQTFQDFECVITDDFSTDKTLEICKQWLSENPEFQARTKIIENPENTGVSANVNRGLKVASCEWIQVLSADDMFPKDSLEKAHKFILENPECAIFQGIAASYNNNFSEENFVKNIVSNTKKPNFFALSAQQQHRQLLRYCHVVAPAVFYKKSLVEQVGFCDESNPMIDDWPLWQKITKAGYKFYFLNEIVINYRLHEQSISSKLFKDKKNKTLRNPNHVAVFWHNFELSGGMTVCINYVDVLIKNGYKVDVVVANSKGVGKNLFSKQATIVNLGDVRVRHSIGKLRQYLKQSHVSSLICFGNLCNFAGVLATFGLRDRINLILSQHSFTYDFDVLDTGFVGKLTPFLKRKLYPLANRIIAVSNGVFEDLKALKIPAEKISVVPNFIDKNHIQELAKQPISQELPKDYILFVGRLARVKNIDLLIQAMDFVDENIHLVIAGTGTGYGVRGTGFDPKLPTNNTSHLAPRNLAPLAERVHFIGEISNVLPIIKNSKTVAIPSFSETLSMVAIEAAALGKTVVHTPNSGCMEIFGTDGSYCSKTFDDPKEFAETLKKALENPISADVLDEKVSRFEKKNVWPLLEKVVSDSC